MCCRRHCLMELSSLPVCNIHVKPHKTAYNIIICMTADVEWGREIYFSIIMVCNICATGSFRKLILLMIYMDLRQFFHSQPSSIINKKSPWDDSFRIFFINLLSRVEKYSIATKKCDRDFFMFVFGINSIATYHLMIDDGFFLTHSLVWRAFNLFINPFRLVKFSWWNFMQLEISIFISTHANIH